MLDVKQYILDIPTFMYIFLLDQSNDKNGCSEFLSYEIELRNRGTQNDVTLRLENIYRNSSLKPLTRLHKILN